MGKKKLKTSLSFPNHVGTHHYSKGAKKSNRINGGKLNGPSATATRPAETEPTTTYGVVPSEYNIQAQINWLTAPPSSNDKKNSSNNVPQPGPSKKPQRGYHKDVCDGCGEGECLMYCDKCPAAFHAICDDPPLPPEDFEAIGQTWKCKKCRNMVAIKTEDSEDATATSRYTNGGPINLFFQQSLPHFHTQNPAQFKLPKEMPAYDYPFPGTSRHLLKTCRPRTTVIDVENGIVPRPISLCFHCQKSCRIGALIQCDKCDSFFHLDCVDPPLTTIPTSVWICPLHVEPYLESTQLTSVALSERVKIWENGDKPINRSAIILDFLKKTSRRNPMFRRKKPIRMVVNHDSVPEMVRNSYREDVVSLNERFGGLHMLASICDMELFSLSMHEQVSNHRKGWDQLYLPVGMKIAEDKAKLDMIQRKNGSKMELLAQMMQLYNSDEAAETETQPKELAVAGQQEDPSKKNSPAEDWIRKELKTMFMDLTRDKTKVCQINDDLKDISHKIYGTPEQAPDPPIPMPEQVQGVSINTLPSEKRTTTAGRDGSTVQDKVNQMKYLPKKTLRKLAACHLRYMQRRKEIRERAKLKNKERYLAPLKSPPKSVLSLYVENVGVTVEMTSQSFWIGSSDSCDWKITDLVKCNRIQRKHAKMFFNPVESCWEILNYSPNGIYVNNTWFGFKDSGATPSSTTVTSERYQEIQERNTRRVDEYIENSNGELQGKDVSPCYCKPFPVRAMSNALEGSAKIHVGNKIQIGCAKIQVQGFLSSLL